MQLLLHHQLTVLSYKVMNHTMHTARSHYLRWVFLAHNTIGTGGLGTRGTRNVSEAQPTRTWAHPISYYVHLVGASLLILGVTKFPYAAWVPHQKYTIKLQNMLAEYFPFLSGICIYMPRCRCCGHARPRPQCLIHPQFSEYTWPCVRLSLSHISRNASYTNPLKKIVQNVFSISEAAERARRQVSLHINCRPYMNFILNTKLSLYWQILLH